MEKFKKINSFIHQLDEIIDQKNHNFVYIEAIFLIKIV